MYGLLVTIVARDYHHHGGPVGMAGFNIPFSSPIDRDIFKQDLESKYSQFDYEVIVTEYKA